MSAQYHASLRHLSRAVFVNFELVESAVPPVGEVEDRHVEHKHRIMHSPAAPEYFSLLARETSWRSFHCCSSFVKKSSTIHFSSRVHSLGFLVDQRRPPATRSVSPVTHLESSEAKKTAAGAMSSVSPTRPSGVCDSNIFRMSPSV